MQVLTDLIEHAANRFPANIAISYNQENIDYLNLKKRIDAIALYLLDKDINYQTKVAIFLNTDPLFVSTFFALSKIGAIVATFNINYKEEELSNYLKALKIKHIILTQQAKNRYGKSKLNSLVKTITVDNYPKLINHSSGGQDINAKVSSSDEVLYQFSSGSTGKPKVSSRNHSNILSEAESVAKTIKFSSRDKILCAVPLYHAYGFGSAMTPAIYSGATLILLDKFNPRKVLNIFKQKKITIFFGVPYMFNVLSSIYNTKKIDFPSLKYCFSAGISLPKEISKKFYDKFGVFVRDLYGTTETGCISVNLNKNIESMLSSVGLPIKGTKIEIIQKNGKKSKVGQTGEIIVKTPTCGQWYHLGNQKRLVTKNRYLYTGDIGKKDKEGNLYILSRKTSFINIAGEKVDPKEVEAVLLRYLGIKEAVVLGFPDKLRGQVVKAVVVLKNKSISLDKKLLLRYCREKLANFKVPRIVIIRDKLPRNSLGKLLKGYL